jgi:hypothetical protein
MFGYQQVGPSIQAILVDGHHRKNTVKYTYQGLGV